MFQTRFGSFFGSFFAFFKPFFVSILKFFGGSFVLHACRPKKYLTFGPLAEGLVCCFFSALKKMAKGRRIRVLTISGWHRNPIGNQNH